MYKIMNNPYIRQPFFAADDGGAGGTGGDGDQEENAGGDDPDGEDPDEDGESEKKYTQAEVDATVEKRLAREKRKWQRSQKEQEKQEEDKKEKAEDGEGADKEELKKERNRNQKLTMRLACYEAGVPKDSVKDVTALAKSYMEDDEELDFEDAIEKVLEKYPQFKGEDSGEKGSWGQRQKGKGAKTEKSLEDEITAALYRE